jgi:plastocyanin
MMADVERCGRRVTPQVGLLGRDAALDDVYIFTMLPSTHPIGTSFAAVALALLWSLQGSAIAAATTDPPPPLEPCDLEEGEVALTRDGITEAPPPPGLQESSSRAWVVDLAGEAPDTVARVAVHLTWDMRAEGFDLTATTAQGEAISDAVQPDAEAVEHIDLGPLPHCSRVALTIDNVHALVGQGLSLTGTLDPAPYTAPPALSDSLPDPGPLPGSPAVVVAPPSGQVIGFVPPAGAITPGGSLTLVGADGTPHNLLCADRDADRRPLCRSDYVVAGETADVEGVDALPPGEYEMFCGLHPIMTFTLTVLPGAR